MERAAARRLQPHFIRLFFEQAFEKIGGRVARREERRYEITHVLRRSGTSGRGPRRRIGATEVRTGDLRADRMLVPGRPPAALIAPGHRSSTPFSVSPWSETEACWSGGPSWWTTATRATRPPVDVPRTLHHRRRTTAGGRAKTVSRRFQFVFMNAQSATTAPKVPLSGLPRSDPDELAAVDGLRSERWCAAMWRRGRWTTPSVTLLPST